MTEEKKLSQEEIKAKMLDLARRLQVLSSSNSYTADKEEAIRKEYQELVKQYATTIPELEPIELERSITFVGRGFNGPIKVGQKSAYYNGKAVTLQWDNQGNLLAAYKQIIDDFIQQPVVARHRISVKDTVPEEPTKPENLEAQRTSKVEEAESMGMKPNLGPDARLCPKCGAANYKLMKNCRVCHHPLDQPTEDKLTPLHPNQSKRYFSWVNRNHPDKKATENPKKLTGT